VAASIAVAEAVALIVLGVLVLGKDWFEPGRAAANGKAQAATTQKEKPAAATSESQSGAAPALPVPEHALLSRKATGILVLNGNGKDGAAGDEARVVRARGYVVTEVTNAKRTDYGRDIVMFRPGYGREARRLARDVDVPVVTPLDGLWPSQLKKAKLALIVGS